MYACNKINANRSHTFENKSKEEHMGGFDGRKGTGDDVI